MKCRRCGAQNAPNVNKCIYCGTSLVQPNHLKANANVKPEADRRMNNNSSKKARSKTENIIISIIAVLGFTLVVLGGIYFFTPSSGNNTFSGGGGGGGGGFVPGGNAVSFSMNCDEAIGQAPQTQYVPDGGFATDPGAVSRDGYDFGGWHTDGEGTTPFSFDTPINADITLYAKWYSSLYGIYGVSRDGNNVNVTLSTDEACTVKVMIYDDEGQNLLKEAAASVEASQQMAQKTVTVSDVSWPQYFLIRVMLVDASGNALTNTYTCIDHTSLHAEFMKKTTADFPAEQVLKFAESDTNNFGVLNSEVEKVVVTEQDNLLNTELSKIEELYFVFNNVTEALRDTQVGDALYVDYDTGYFVTVESFNLEGDTLKVRGTTDYEIKDYFDYIKVDMEIDPSNQETQQLPAYTSDNVDNMAQVIDVEATLGNLKFAKPVDWKINDYVTFKGSTYIELKPHLVIKWDAKWGQKDYFQIKFEVEVTTATEAELEWEDLPSDPIEIKNKNGVIAGIDVLIGKVVIPFGVTGLNTQIELYTPIEVNLKGSIKYTNKQVSNYYVSVDNINGLQKYSSTSPTNSESVTAKGEFEFSIGAKLVESIAFLDKAFKLSLTQEAKAYAKVTGEINLDTTEHLCAFCAEGEIGVKLSISGSASYHITREFSGTFASITFAEVKAGIKTCHYSSISGFDWGVCPNKASNLGKCKLEGKITIADDDTDNTNNRPLAGATVKIKNKATGRVSEVTTNDTGMYEIEKLLNGEHEITVNKEGYIPVSQTVSIAEDRTNMYNMIIEAISEDDAGLGAASGTVKDDITGQGVAGLTLSVRAGINSLVGEVIQTTTTSGNGTYLLEDLPSGHYTIHIKDNRSLDNEAERYYESSFNIKVLGGKTIANQDGAVTNGIQVNQLKIRLRWGEMPRDLDSHLRGPTSDGGSFHIYYRSKRYIEDGEVMADLDLDNISGYGPETTTIHTPVDGVYTFSVHDFSNRSSTNSTALANSGAYIEVFLGTSTTASAKYYVPTGGGTVWTVFSYNSETNEITDINTMSYESDPSDV